MGNVIVYFVTLVANIIILLWWRHACKWEEGTTSPFPSRGHVLIFIVTALLPIWNIMQIAVLLGFYIGFRVSGTLELKKNKFNNFWFNTGTEKKKD